MVIVFLSNSTPAKSVYKCYSKVETRSSVTYISISIHCIVLYSETSKIPDTFGHWNFVRYLELSAIQRVQFVVCDKLIGL